MSESDNKIGSRGTKLSEWKEHEKLQPSGKNAFKVFRRLKNQLKAEAFSGMATALNSYPAIAYVVP